MTERKVTPATKKRIAGKQYNQCNNKPGKILAGLENYSCPLWQKSTNDSSRGNFDESGYEVDHIIEHAISNDDSDENLQALCKMCHAVKTKRFLAKNNLAAEKPKYKVYSGWNLFNSDYRKKLNDLRTSLSKEDKSKMVSSAWKNLSKAEKQMWDNKAKEKTLQEKTLIENKSLTTVDNSKNDDVIAGSKNSFCLRTGISPPYIAAEKIMYIPCPKKLMDYKGDIIVIIKQLETSPLEFDVEFMVSHAIFSLDQISSRQGALVDISPLYTTTHVGIFTPKQKNICLQFSTVETNSTNCKVFGIECRKSSSTLGFLPDYVFQHPWKIEYSVQKIPSSATLNKEQDEVQNKASQDMKSLVTSVGPRFGSTIPDFLFTEFKEQVTKQPLDCIKKINTNQPDTVVDKGDLYLDEFVLL